MSWKRMWFKDSKVFVRVDDDGEPVVRDGRVDICYKPNDPRVYKGGADKIRALDEPTPLVPEQTIASEPEAAAPKAAPRKPTTARPPKTQAPAGPPSGATIEVWTDGACSGNPGDAGLGVVMRSGENVLEISRYLGKATNNIAELTAIQVALEHLRSRRRPVRIHSDSAYAIGVLTKGWKAKKNPELVAEIRDLIAQFPYLELIKVAGHAGVPENERADELAVMAVRDRADWEGRSKH
jgi:ribonuclease HI